MTAEERDWRDIGKGGSRGWEESNYETLVREPEETEAKVVAQHLLEVARWVSGGDRERELRRLEEAHPWLTAAG